VRILAACCLLIVALQYLGQWLALRSLLKNSTPTTEQITLAEQYKQASFLLSPASLIVFLVLWFVGCLFYIYDMLTVDNWSVASIIILVGLVWILVYFGAVLRSKLRSSGLCR